MKRLIMTILAVATAAMLFCSCSSTQIAKTQASSLLAPVLGLGGALAASHMAKDEDDGTRLAATGAAAAGAFLLGQFIENGFKEEKAKEYKAGYDLGRSNSAKELYWLYQKLHQAEEGEVTRSRVYELPVQYPDNGVKYVPSSVSLSVTE
jgi:hypothetical protein